MQYFNAWICSLLLSSCLLLSSDKKQPETVYCHGLGGSYFELEDCRERGFIQDPSSSFSFDDNGSSLGQGEDIEKIKQHIDSERNHILYGNSRGAAANISYVGQYNPENISAMVLKSAPADMLNVVDEWQYKIGFFPLWTRFSKEWVLRTAFPNYPVNSVPPVDAIVQIANKELPVFIAHSTVDEVVNVRSGYQLYNAFKKAGFANVYLCELQESGHNYMTSKDSDCYGQALHSFYKQHGFKYDKAKAILSPLDFKNLQPTMEEIDKKLDLNQWALRSQSIVNICILSSVIAIGVAIKYLKKIKK